MPRPASPLASISPRRALLAAALGLSLFLGALPHGDTAEHRESPRGVDIDRDARHPDAPAHFEASKVEFQPGCPLCVLQLATGWALQLPESPLPPLLPRGAVLAAAERADSTSATHLRPARAPPSLSSSL